eukprot:TRINITY_DN34374_c0_g1_i1.p1 TRINITY_DN34374_c0_g1~~TRINITY_DN34374_c0_g1_i1.p1  ORF type:complete len:550 (+),score=178.15 TRINITY_DN34374_c0_g1_i1:71-1651(+)
MAQQAADWRAAGRRVTVFSLAGCPHCQKAKALLQELDHPYTEISLTEYPEKRGDMLAIADRLTVPQVFFGNMHIGGATELAGMHTLGKLKGALAARDPSDEQLDPRLLPPEYPPKPQAALPHHEEQLVCLLGEDCVTYAAMVEGLSKSLDIHQNRRGLRTYPRSFKGSAAVTVLMQRHKLKSRAEAVRAGEQLLQTGLIRHVDRARPFEDSDELYRLQAHDEPLVLNRWRRASLEPAHTPEPPHLVIKALAKRLRGLRAAHTTEHGVDYLAVRADPGFSGFQDAAAELQRVDLGGMSPDERLAFTINLYNMAISHAFCVVGIPETDLQRLSYFDDVRYDVGGLTYSLNDLENGVLRGNRRPPYHLSTPFGSSDPRLKTALAEPDNRIHFALNCGAKSCPPVKDFTPEAVREELRLAASAFCNDMEDHVRVDEARGVLWLSQIFSWYSADFGGGGEPTARQVLAWLRGEKKAQLERILQSGRLKVKHLDYDWSTDARPGHFLKFTSASQAKQVATGTKHDGCSCTLQ